MIEKLNEKLERLVKRVKDYTAPLPKIPPAPPVDNEFYNAGKEYYSKGLYKEAIREYEKALELDRKNKHAWNELGLAYNKIDEGWKAMDAYYHALELDPKDVVIWVNLGLIYKLKKEYQNAIKTYKMALEVNENFKEAWSDLGSTYDKIDEDEKAIDAYKHALLIDPNYLTALNNIGASFNKIGDYDAAIEFLKKATERKPDISNPWNHLGYAYYKKKDYTTAIRHLEKAVELNSEYTLGWINLAKAQFANKENNQAYLSCENALKLEPDNTSALKLMNKIKKAMGVLDDEQKKAFNEKMNKMLKVSTKINLEMMRKALRMQEDAFSEKIFEWAEEFNFTIDGDYLVVNKDTIDDFINTLDAQFESWKIKEKGSNGKI